MAIVGLSSSSHRLVRGRKRLSARVQVVSIAAVLVLAATMGLADAGEQRASMQMHGTRVDVEAYPGLAAQFSTFLRLSASGTIEGKDVIIGVDQQLGSSVNQNAEVLFRDSTIRVRSFGTPVVIGVRQR